MSETIEPAMAVTSLVELDVHLFRGRVEVRHGKILWPFAKLWERWELLPDETPRPELGSILAAMPDGAHLWLDLKGFRRSLSRRVLAEVGDRRPLTVSSRSWWLLGPLREVPGMRTFRSVGSRWQLWLVQRLRAGAEHDGIVIYERLLNRASIDRLHGLTPTVFVWSVDDLSCALQLADLGASGLIVDDLALIAQINHHVNGR